MVVKIFFNIIQIILFCIFGTYFGSKAVLACAGLVIFIYFKDAVLESYQKGFYGNKTK